MTDQWAALLWQRFKDLYGQKWLSLFAGDDEVMTWRSTWGSGLKFDAEEIKYALSRLGSDFPDWPPTFGQFKQLCEAMPKPYLSLPAPPKVKPAPECMQALLSAAQGERKGPWWAPERVVNSQQVNLIVVQAQRFGPDSMQGRFLDQCKAYGCIGSDNQFQRVQKAAA